MGRATESTAFLNGEIDAEVYMKIQEGLCVEGEVVRLLKEVHGIRPGSADLSMLYAFYCRSMWMTLNSLQTLVRRSSL